MPLYSKLPRPGDRAFIALGHSNAANQVNHPWQPLTSGNRFAANSSIVLAEILVDTLFHMDIRRNDREFDGVQFYYNDPSHPSAVAHAADGTSRNIVQTSGMYSTGYLDQAYTSLRLTDSLTIEAKRFLGDFILPVVYGDNDYIRLVQDINRSEELPPSVVVSKDAIIAKAQELGIRVLPFAPMNEHLSTLPENWQQAIDTRHALFLTNMEGPQTVEVNTPAGVVDAVRSYTIATTAIPDFEVIASGPQPGGGGVISWTDAVASVTVPQTAEPSAESDPVEYDDTWMDEDEEAA